LEGEPRHLGLALVTDEEGAPKYLRRFPLSSETVFEKPALPLYKPLLLLDIPPGGYIEGHGCFEIPSDARAETLIFKYGGYRRIGPTIEVEIEL